MACGRVKWKEWACSSAAQHRRNWEESPEAKVIRRKNNIMDIEMELEGWNKATKDDNNAVMVQCLRQGCIHGLDGVE